MNLEDLFELTRDYQKAHHWGTYPYKHFELLKLLVSIHKPKRVLELGTAIGLTAISMAMGDSNVVVDSIEKEAQNIEEAKKYAKEFGVEERINFIEGAFKDEIPKITKKYDLIFFDGFSPHLEMLLWLEKILNPNGLMIFANLNLGDESENCLKRFEDLSIYSSKWFFDDTALGVKR